MKFILKFPTPYRLATSTISQRITCLNHKAFDDSVENKIVVIAIPAMGCEILDSFWTLLRVQFHVYVAHCSVHNLDKHTTFMRKKNPTNQKAKVQVIRLWKKTFGCTRKQGRMWLKARSVTDEEYTREVNSRKNQNKRCFYCIICMVL